MLRKIKSILEKRKGKKGCKVGLRKEKGDSRKRRKNELKERTRRKENGRMKF